jgi:hypothetical protein
MQVTDRQLAVSNAALYSGSPRFELQVCYRYYWPEDFRGFNKYADDSVLNRLRPLLSEHLYTHCLYNVPSDSMMYKIFSSQDGNKRAKRRCFCNALCLLTLPDHSSVLYVLLVNTLGKVEKHFILKVFQNGMFRGKYETRRDDIIRGHRIFQNDERQNLQVFNKYY